MSQSLACKFTIRPIAAMMFAVFVLCTGMPARAQLPMIGAHNGETWRSLVIGTQAETMSRKTFYIDGMYNMSVFWSEHSTTAKNGIDYNDAFLDMNVGQIRDGLDSFYVDDKNLQVPIIDAILILRMQAAKISRVKIDEVTSEFRKATVNGIDPTQENKVWQTALKLLR